MFYVAQVKGFVIIALTGLLLATFLFNYVEYFLDGSAASTLQELLIFFTGAHRVPPLGVIPKPCVEFANSSKYPLGNICADVPSLPSPDTQEMFKD